MRRPVSPLAIIAGLAAFLAGASARAEALTRWGWPLPYERVSDRSIDWLKKQRWWPLGGAVVQSEPIARSPDAA